MDGLGTTIGEEIEDNGFRVGTLFANRYEVLTEGHKGGMGAVYKCKDTKLNEIVALKVIHPRLLSSPQALTRFRQEVSISRKLQHPNIVRVFNLEESEGKEYFTMEWIDGVTLREIINKKKKEKCPFSLEDANKIIAQLADALSNAHKYTIHRDIKPENILVTDEKELKVKLSDFGIAKMLSPSQFTSTSMQMGTPYYMAPEQKDDSGNIDKRADIYALGVVLFELLTLENTMGLELPSEINKALPSTIDAIIKKGVATKPADRYVDAKEMSEALDKIVAVSKQQREKEIQEETRRQELEQKKKAEEERKAREKEEAERRRIEELKSKEDEQRRQSEPDEEQRRIKREKFRSGIRSTAAIALAVIVVLVILVAFISYQKRSKDEQAEMLRKQSVALQQTHQTPSQEQLQKQVLEQQKKIDEQMKQLKSKIVPKPQQVQRVQQQPKAQQKSDARGAQSDPTRKAAEQGNSDSQYKLGRMFEKGTGVRQDSSEAVKWYRKAAEQGNATAQTSLGNMYLRGDGVKKDDAEAVKWFRKAAEQGDKWGQVFTGLAYLYGKGVKKDDAEALKWYRKAAEQGSASSQYRVGFMYEKGTGVRQDSSEAIKWYRAAATQGDENAKAALKRLGK
jgi:serine/threonine protein kinase